jgi:tRNA dimethylallyltransferase
LLSSAQAHRLKNKTVIVIAGPTASGKTALSLRLARQFSTSVISADSRQCYKELDIGVAKPSLEQLLAVPHHFVSSHSLQEEINAMRFEQLALSWADNIFRDRKVLVMAGGTGLYLKAFCEGLDDMPAVDPHIREKIQLEYEQGGIGWLQEQIKIKDPDFYTSGEIRNPRRLMRALEIKLSTGQSILSFRTSQKKQRPFHIVKIGMELPKDQLNRQIDLRVNNMIEQGLLKEVKNLLPYRHLNALQTVGYREIIQHLDGEISLDQAIKNIKTNTRQYAKRQTTWFKKDPSIQWVHPEDDQAIEKIIKS